MNVQSIWPPEDVTKSRRVNESAQEGTGTRVMGSAKNAMVTKVATRRDLVWEVPESWSLAEAATG